MPKYLSALAPLDGARKKRQRRIESHLSARLRAGYRLDEVLEELSMLGWCIRRVCGEERLTAAGREALDDALREDAAVVVESFGEYLREDEQGEKFYLRRLQGLSAEAFRNGLAAGAREDRLGPILALMMEATESQCAAILLYDSGARTLSMTASAGVHEPSARYAVDEATSSFAALVASREETTTVLDVAVTMLEVSGTLRTSGIHEVMGVRLPMQNELVGVLYVGLGEGRTSTSRQVRRLESMGEKLSLHLDRARLNDALHATIQDLQVERELRERFISLLAHDLRGPLSVLRMGAQLLLPHVDHLGEQRDVPGRLLRNVVRADRMTNDLLDVLRIRAGHGLSLVLGECDLDEVARSTMDELAGLHGQRFVLRGAEHVRGVWSADALQRALWNLCSNAVKYGAPGAPVVVTIRRLDAGVAIDVHNEGPAIPTAALTALFEPFNRLAGAAYNERQGWGLGLTMVKSCAEAHGGTISVESTAERGTTFTIGIPLDARPFQSHPGVAA